MKLIINIPEEVYKNIQQRSTEVQAEGYILENAVLNGTPLDDVKAKIETDLSWEMFDEYGNETSLHKVLMEILDNGNKENKE